MILEKLPRFDQELETIALFIAKDSPTRALAFYDELIEKIELIPLNPMVYRQRLQLDDENMRELIYKGYTVPFYIDREKDKVLVLGIFGQNVWDIEER